MRRAVFARWCPYIVLVAVVVAMVALGLALPLIFGSKG